MIGMTVEEAIHVIKSNRPTSGYTMLCEALDMAIDALREQEERENVWHDAKDNPPQKPGLYYGKKDDTDSMYLCQYRDGVWTIDAYPETRMHVIKWAYYNAFAQEYEWWRWIPVTERLPEEGDYVLCVLKGFNYGGKIQVCKFVPADKFKDKPYFEHFRNGFPSVTHWMPLPQPPKGE